MMGWRCNTGSSPWNFLHKMASFRFMATNPEALNLGGPSTPHMLFPFDYDEVPTSHTFGGFHPYDMSIEDAVRWWWKFRVLSLQMTTNVSFGAPVGVAPLTRQYSGGMADGEEHNLKFPQITASDTFASPLPGAFIYDGGYLNNDWNGSDGVYQIAATVSLFRKWIVNSQDVDHMLWIEGRDIPDGGTGIAPSVFIQGAVSVSSPATEYSWNFSTVPPPDPEPYEGHSGTFLDGDGGGAITLYFYGSDLTALESVTFAFTIAEEFSWAP